MNMNQTQTAVDLDAVRTRLRDAIADAKELQDTIKDLKARLDPTRATIKADMEALGIHTETLEDGTVARSVEATTQHGSKARADAFLKKTRGEDKRKLVQKAIDAIFEVRTTTRLTIK